MLPRRVENFVTNAVDSASNHPEVVFQFASNVMGAVPNPKVKLAGGVVGLGSGAYSTYQGYKKNDPEKIAAGFTGIVGGGLKTAGGYPTLDPNTSNTLNAVGNTMTTVSALQSAHAAGRHAESKRAIREIERAERDRTLEAGLQPNHAASLRSPVVAPTSSNSSSSASSVNVNRLPGANLAPRGGDIRRAP